MSCTLRLASKTSAGKRDRATAKFIRVRRNFYEEAGLVDAPGYLPVYEQPLRVQPRFVDARQQERALGGRGFFQSACNDGQSDAPVHDEPVAGQAFLDAAGKMAVAILDVIFAPPAPCGQRERGGG